MATTGATSTASSNIQTMVYQLMTNDRIPLQGMQTQKSELQARSRQFQALGSKLSSLLTLTRSFAATGPANPLRTNSVSGGDTNAFAVTATGTAEPGSHSVEVMRLASRHSIASGSVETAILAAESGPTDGSGGASGGGFQARFRITAGGTSQVYSINVAAGATQGDVLSEIARAVNSVHGPVTAGVFAQGGGRSRLVLQSAGTGAAGQITAVEDLEGSWMQGLGLTGSSGQEAGVGGTVQAGVDAWLRVDGVDLYLPENTVREAIPGLTLQLRTTTATPVTFSVERDADRAVTQMQAFITQYNAAVDEVRTLTQAADSTGSNRGLFTGDSNVTRLRTTLREAVAQAVPAGNSIRTLSALGVTTDREGHLQLSDEKKLRAAFDADPQGVEALFNGDGGVAARLAKALEGYGPSGTAYTSQLTSYSGRVKSLDARMARETANLARREKDLTAQLSQMQATVASLSQQQQYLSSLLA
jgi:flagellar hook-associated protein 2